MSFQATVVQKQLEEAGFDAKLAFGITAVLEKHVVHDLETRLVTTAHLDNRLEQLDSKIEAVEARLNSRIDRVESRLETRISQLDAKIETRTSALEVKIESSKAELVRWMVGLVLGSNIALLLALFRFMK